MSPGTDDETADRIRAAALELFATVGYGSSNVDEVAAKAEVGVATLYRRWDDKKALANDVMSRALTAMDNVNLDLESDVPDERFHELWDRFWTWGLAHKHEFLFIETSLNAAFLSEENKSYKAQMNETSAALIASLGLSAPFDLIHSMIVGTIAGLLRNEATIDVQATGERILRALK